MTAAARASCRWSMRFPAACWVWLACGLSCVVGPARAATVSWVPDADGQWTNAGNWSSSPALPGSGDNVQISEAGDRLITLSGANAQTINSLMSNERLTISGTLVVTNTAQVNQTFTIASGGRATLNGTS